MNRRQQRHTDHLLLQACLGDGDRAVDSWKQFREGFDFDVDGPQYMSFLPLVEVNLSRLGFKEPLAGQFRGIRRQIWYRNQLVVKQLADLLTEWRTYTVTPICLTDLAMTQIYHSSPGLRPIRCPEFLVKPEDLSALEESLTTSEWTPSGKEWLGHHLAFSNAEGLNVAFRIHTEIAGLPLVDFFDRAICFNLHGFEARAASPLDQLSFLLARQHSGRMERLLAITDAAIILQNKSIEVDWALAHTQQLRLAPRLRFCTSLRTLSSLSLAPVPVTLARSLADAHAAGRLIPSCLLNSCTSIGNRFSYLNR